MKDRTERILNSLARNDKANYVVDTGQLQAIMKQTSGCVTCNGRIFSIIKKKLAPGTYLITLGPYNY